MGNALGRRPDSENRWFQPAASSPLGEDAAPRGGPAVTDTSRFDPKDPVHSEVHGHLIDDIPQTERMQPGFSTWMGTGLIGTGVDGADAAFELGDGVLSHGGQALLDVAGFVPGLNVLTEGGQAAYHGMHAFNDHEHGRKDEETEELAEAGWHAASAGIDALTLEGGNEANATHKVASTAERAAHTGMSAKHAIHAVHTVLDAGELAWDVTSTLTRALGGTKEQLPFFGAAIPWLLKGGAREGGK